jgi:bacterioferritin-associated ferredoxin
MDYDDEICYCFHVSLRKLVNFARRERPGIPAKMSECLGAGTGCGWCIPILCKIARAADDPDQFRLGMTPDEYAAARTRYREEKHPRHSYEAADSSPGVESGSRSTPGAPQPQPEPEP